MRYLPLTDTDRQAMLATIGISTASATICITAAGRAAALSDTSVSTMPMRSARAPIGTRSGGTAEGVMRRE